MKCKENDTSAIFKTVVYKSNFKLNRSCRSNEAGFQDKLVGSHELRPITCLLLAIWLETFKHQSENLFKLKNCSEIVSRNTSIQNSKNPSRTNSKKTERLDRQREIERGFQNLTEVSKILEHQLNHDIFGLIPTVCQDRFQLDLHGSVDNDFT